METQDKIALLNVYLNEFIFRDKILWSNTFKIFYVSVIVILLPNISNVLDVNFPFFPVLLLRIISFIISIVFLYISLGYAKRVEASTKTYNSMIEKLAPEYRRESIEDLKFGKIFIFRISYVLVFTMFLSLISLNVLLIVFDR